VIRAVTAFEAIADDLTREPFREFIGQQMAANAQIQEWIQRQATARAADVIIDEGGDVTVVVNLLQRDQPEGPRPNVAGFNFQGRGFRIGEDSAPSTGATPPQQDPVPMEVDEPPAPPVIPVGTEQSQPERFNIGAPAGSELSQSTIEYTEGAADIAEAETQAETAPTTGEPSRFWDAVPSEEATARATELANIRERIAQEVTITIDDQSSPQTVPSVPDSASQSSQVPSAPQPSMDLGNMEWEREKKAMFEQIFANT
jgi:hypothetical protein